MRVGCRRSCDGIEEVRGGGGEWKMRGMDESGEEGIEE